MKRGKFVKQVPDKATWECLTCNETFEMEGYKFPVFCPKCNALLKTKKKIVRFE